MFPKFDGGQASYLELDERHMTQTALMNPNKSDGAIEAVTPQSSNADAMVDGEAECNSDLPDDERKQINEEQPLCEGRLELSAFTSHLNDLTPQENDEK